MFVPGNEFNATPRPHHSDRQSRSSPATSASLQSSLIFPPRSCLHANRLLHGRKEATNTNLRFYFTETLRFSMGLTMLYRGNAVDKRNGYAWGFSKLEYKSFRPGAISSTVIDGMYAWCVYWNENTLNREAGRTSSS